MLNQKIEGALYGHLIGDALGTRYEFMKSPDAKKQVEKDSKHGFLYILGGGPFNLVPGQVTDDSELSIGLLHSLLKSKMYKKEDVAQKYLKWFSSKPFDIGQTTLKAFRGANNYTDIVHNSKKYNQNSLSNGCLMRIIPLAIYGVKTDNNILSKYCYEDSQMTNPNEITTDATLVYCFAIKLALQSYNKKEIVKYAYHIAKTQLVKNIIKLSMIQPEPVLLPDGSYTKTDGHQMGYFGIALQNAFYELLHGQSFYESICNIIKRGGDTDTNACIAGGLLGGYYGKNSIPGKWIDSIRIYNPRVIDYEDIDQRNISLHIKEFIDLINKL